jgi:superoxide dismutase, Cu-Zn family
MKLLVTAVFLTAACTTQGLADIGDSATAELSGDGINGTVRMVETASGMVHVEVTATGVPEGVHGFHVHETGACDASQNFESAGGHLAGDLQHGVQEVGGPHPGDMPNVHAGADGNVHVEYFTFGFKITPGGQAPSILDEDGSAVVLHAQPDDYKTQPSGDAGARIACGVLVED